NCRLAPLAHAWLEQRTHNPLVPCSTHGGGTTEYFNVINALREPTGLYPINGGCPWLYPINAQALPHNRGKGTRLWLFPIIGGRALIKYGASHHPNRTGPRP